MRRFILMHYLQKLFTVIKYKIRLTKQSHEIVLTCYPYDGFIQQAWKRKYHFPKLSLVNVTIVVTPFSALEVTRQALRNVGIDNQLQCEIFKVNQTSRLFLFGWFSFNIELSSSSLLLHASSS